MATTTHRGRLVASAVGAAGILLWATETGLITLTGGLPPLQTVALAFAVAALLSAVISRATGANPLSAFRQPVGVWVVTVGALTGFHACIYFAVQHAPPVSAALLQGTTPLMIVLGSAFLPGERLTWWHVAGATAGLAGAVSLLGGHAAATVPGNNPAFYLAIVGAAAAIWGLYSLFSRARSEVPTSAMGGFFAASAIVAAIAHLGLETWTPPTGGEWAAIAALGAFPMGLALIFWDYGVKRGDIQALGTFSYSEPLAGALFVALLGQGELSWRLLAGGLLIVGGSLLGSRGMWGQRTPAVLPASETAFDMPSPMRTRQAAREIYVPRRLPTAGRAAETIALLDSVCDELTSICDELTAMLAPRPDDRPDPAGLDDSAGAPRLAAAAQRASLLGRSLARAYAEQSSRAAAESTTRLPSSA